MGSKAVLIKLYQIVISRLVLMIVFEIHYNFFIVLPILLEDLMVSCF